MLQECRKKSVHFLISILSILYLSNSLFSQDRPIGMNLDYHKDWNTQLLFVDFMTYARPWMTRNADNSGSWNSGYSDLIPLRSDDLYPIEVPFTVGVIPFQIVHTVLRAGDDDYPTGSYTLIFSGQGKVRLKGDVSGTYDTPDINIPIQIDQTTDTGIFLEIIESDPADPVCNIRFIMPGYLSTFESQPYHPRALSLLDPFDVIRFMKPLRIGETTVEAWSERTQVNHYSQAICSGIAYEHVARLCNILETDLWLNVPHRADDAYVRHLAQLLLTELDAVRKIYIEYSNEVWSKLNIQNEWCKQKGIEQGLATDHVLAQRKYYTKRCLEIFDIFEDVFGSGQRLVKVIAGQRGNIQVGETCLQSLADPQINPKSITVDAYSVGCYVGGKIADNVGDQGLMDVITVEAILDSLEANLNDAYIARLQSHSDLADQYGLQFLTYEGGQHLKPTKQAYLSNRPFTMKLNDANRHERMRTFYHDLYNVWYEHFGGLFTTFSFVNKYGTGSFGHFETMDQSIDTAPKYQALMDCVFEGGTGVSPKSESPNEFLLMQNYPNPFNPTTTIRFRIYEPGPVHIDVYSSYGQRVRSLLSENMSPGNHLVFWDGKDDRGIQLSSGVYVCQITMVGVSSHAIKMVLMK